MWLSCYNKTSQRNRLRKRIFFFGNSPVFMEIEGDVRKERTVVAQDIIYENVTYYLHEQKNTVNKTK